MSDRCKAVIQATIGGHIPVIQYLTPEGIDLPADVMQRVAKISIQKGHLHILQLLLPDSAALPPPLRAETILWAAEKGQREIIEYLLPPGAEYALEDRRTAALLASASGHFGAALFLADGDPHLEKEALMSALKAGNTETADLFLARGLTLDAEEYMEAILAAASRGDASAFRRITKRAPPLDEEGRGRVVVESCRGTMDSLPILQEIFNGAEPTIPMEAREQALLIEQRKGNGPAVSLLLEEPGISEAILQEALLGAATDGDYAIVQALLAYAPDLDREAAIECAECNDYEEIADLLRTWHPQE